MSSPRACQFRVLSYELEAYGHVNHAVFLNYYEQARVEYLDQKGMSFASLREEGYLFIIVRAEVDYIRPLKTLDWIEVVGWVEEIGKSSITIRQEIYKLPAREIVSRGKFVAVFTDRNSGQPVPVPENFKRAFQPSDGTPL